MNSVNSDSDNYWYDAAGERTVKSSGGGEGVSVNGIMSGGRTGTTNFTAYISPYLVVNNGGNYTKHIYIGSQRITSKVSNSGIFTASPVTTTDLQAKYTTLTAKIKERYDSLGVAYKGTPQTGGLVSSNPSAAVSPYFYHSDHLGSSSLITDGAGAVTQHLEYVPFGEVFIDERRSASSWTTPYLFSAKERDEETGLSYFGARYYDSRTSVWLSVDPLAEKKPFMSSYIYCLNNPLRYIDPDGRDEWEMNKRGEIVGDPSKNKSLQTKEHDAFYIVDENGKRTGESVSFDYGTVKEHKKPSVNGKQTDIFRIKGDRNATNLFEFLANKTGNVEWTHAKIGTENSGDNIVGTSHQETSTSVGQYLRSKGYSLREVNHNHPHDIPYPSWDQSNGVGNSKKGDVPNARLYEIANPNIKLNVYTKKYGYSPYDSHGTLDMRLLDYKTP
jgi:RHS repeat-associated protein